MSVLNAEHFKDEAAAYAFVEARVWPEGRVCPHCGVVDQSGALKGKSTRVGVYKCYACRKPFTVKVGTIFESSHIPMHIWLQAMFLLCSSKKGMSANQLHRILGVTLKSAWFMSHRIRAAMDPFHASQPLPTMGGEGKIIEMDETYIGRKEGRKLNRGGPSHKHMVMSLVERGGEVRSFHLAGPDRESMKQVVDANVRKESHYYTDGWHAYRNNAMQLAGHDWVDHSKDEYVRGDVHTNTVEGYFSVFKRGMIGTYQHCGEQHLHRYLAEFDFRQSNRAKLGVDDQSRATKAVDGIVGKRLTYKALIQ